MTHEIVTLQVGNYANYVGTHWWNFQGSSFCFDPNEKSEISHGIMFREGLNPQGVQTYLPRAVCFDLKGNLEAAVVDKGLYEGDPAVDRSLWSGSVSVYGSDVKCGDQITSAGEKVEIQGERVNAPLSNTKKSLWSDHVITPLHPRSVHVFNDYTFNTETCHFDSYFDGTELASSVTEMDDIETRIRYFTEECDYLQGFHLLTELGNGFGGVSAHIASYLEDEFKNKPILAIPLFNLSKENEDPSNCIKTTLNSFICLEKLMSLCQLTIPLSIYANVMPLKGRIFRTFPFLSFDADVANNSSAVLAAALDTATMMYRLKDRTMDLFEYLQTFNLNGRRVAALSTVLPFPVYDDRSIVETLLKLDADVQLHSLTPSCNVMRNRDLARLGILRGLPSDMKLSFDKLEHLNYPKKFQHFEDLLNWYMQQMTASKFGVIRQMGSALNLDSGYSNVFDNRVTKVGTISAELRTVDTDICSVPVLSAVHSSDNLNLFFQELLDGVSSANAAKFRKQIISCLEEDDFIHIVENVKHFQSCFSDAGAFL